MRFTRDKKINILTLVLSEKKSLNETKNHNPLPLQVKWSVPKHDRKCHLHIFLKIKKNKLELVSCADVLSVIMKEAA